MRVGSPPCSRRKARNAATHGFPLPGATNSEVVPSRLSRYTLEAIRGELTVAQLVSKHGVHQTLINGWKKPALDGLCGMFAGRTETAERDREEEVARLHEKIGQLVVERDFLRKASGR